MSYPGRIIWQTDELAAQGCYEDPLTSHLGSSSALSQGQQCFSTSSSVRKTMRPRREHEMSLVIN